jgi:biopolymer transport protein ExbD
MKRRRKRRDMIFPDLTPLIDIVFLLLIFFMVVSSFDKYSALDIKLPKVSLQTEREEKSYELIIDRNEKYFLRDTSNDTKEEIQLELLLKRVQGIQNVSVTADKDLKYEVVAKVMGILKKAGIENMGLNFYE